MKWILVVLLATQLALYNARPSDNLFEWKASSLSSWPQTQLLFPPADFLNTARDNLQLFSPDNRVIHAAKPFTWTSYSGLILNPYHPYSYFYRPNLLPSITTEFQAPKLKPTSPARPTANPVNKFPESTTKLPSIKRERPPLKNDKLTEPISGTFESDSRLISAVQVVNPTFVIENIMQIPGTRLLKHASVQQFSQNQQDKPKKFPSERSSQDVNSIKVEAAGNTAASQSVPNISLGSYFLPYSSNTLNDDKKIASLILQPRSKAIVGNGGTAISAPISRAILRKGVPTNVFFSPESVAIAGAGGKAHAQADLILDLMER